MQQQAPPSTSASPSGGPSPSPAGTGAPILESGIRFLTEALGMEPLERLEG